MRERDDDARLRARFHAMRAADAPGVPAFDAVLARRVAERRARVWPLVAGAAAAVLMLVVVTAGPWRVRRSAELVAPSEVIELARWTPPTDALLEGARMHLITQAPTLGASMVDTLRGAMR